MLNKIRVKCDKCGKEMFHTCFYKHRISHKNCIEADYIAIDVNVKLEYIEDDDMSISSLSKISFEILPDISKYPQRILLENGNDLKNQSKEDDDMSINSMSEISFEIFPDIFKISS